MTSDAVQHPSYFDLDCLALGEHLSGIDDHVRTCTQCRAYLDRIVHDAEVPAWASRLTRSPAPVSKKRAFSAWWLPGLALAGATAAVLVMVQSTTPDPTASTRSMVVEKGLPAAALFVKRGDAVFAWREGQLLAPGDQVRLQVAPAGSSYVTVANCASGEPRVLYAGPAPKKEVDFLPAAWRLDESPDAEILTVTFGSGALGPAALKKLCRDGSINGAQTLSIALPKLPPEQP